MPDLCLYFQVHQPNRLPAREASPGRRMSSPFDDEPMNAAILGRVADTCYLPANRMFQRLIEKNEGRFRMALSISGTVLDQMERHRPDVLDSFRELVAAGGVELLAETYHHSLAFLHSNKEFERQVDLHLEKLEEVFHIRPRVFRNTELIYNDAIAAKAETMGFDGVLGEGVAAHLDGASPNYLYRAPETARIKTLLRNTSLSDDIGFRFSDPSWPIHPLTPGKFASWMANSPGDVVNLFMGYETIGERHGPHTGIFEFWKALPDAVEAAGLQWVTPSEAVNLYRAAREYSCQFLTSWTDDERDLSAWTDSAMQREAMARLYELENDIVAVNDREITDAWRKLQTSNHFHWMSTKERADDRPHSRFNRYAGPHEAHTRFMKALDDLKSRLHTALGNLRNPRCA